MPAKWEREEGVYSYIVRITNEAGEIFTFVSGRTIRANSLEQARRMARDREDEEVRASAKYGHLEQRCIEDVFPEDDQEARADIYRRQLNRYFPSWLRNKEE